MFAVKRERSANAREEESDGVKRAPMEKGPLRCDVRGCGNKGWRATNDLEIKLLGRCWPKRDWNRSEEDGVLDIAQ